MKYIENIKKRTSWRTYEKKTLSQEHMDLVKHFLKSENLKSPFGGPIRFDILEMPDIDPNEKKKLGTYGFIKGVQDFIVGLVKRDKYTWENYGYILEEIILYATSLDLGTCWLGGTFNRSAFKSISNADPNEFIPAITPIGYPANRRMKEKAIRKAIKANNRVAWEKIFFNGNFETPLSKKIAGKFEVPLEMIRLSPSASNKQPWRIVKEEGKNMYHFYLPIGTSKIDKGYKNMRKLDIGIAICHFDHTTRELGYSGRWEIKEPTEISKPNVKYTISWIENI